VLLAAAVALVAVVVAVLVPAGGGGDDDEPAQTARSAAGGAVAGRAEALALFEQIPQDGIALGRRDAPVTIHEFADLQCPFCRDVALRTLPAVIREHVATGRVRIVYRDVAFLGPDSERAALAASAAGEQDRLWQFVQLVYANQGEENAGWVTDGLLNRVFRAIPGLDVAQARRAMAGDAGAADRARARRQARRYGIDGTPAFVAGRTGGTLEPVDPARLGAELDALAGR
jgi:protein-disulfide isomerase